MRGVVYERVKRALEAVLGVPDISGWGRGYAWRPSGLGGRGEYVKVYRVAIRRGKEVLVDLGRLTFRAPRWGYENWAPIFQHLKFFLDVHASGHELAVSATEGRRFARAGGSEMITKPPPCATCGLRHVEDFEGERDGWHYTSLENWQIIRRVGLEPYRMPKLDVAAKEEVSGVWAYLHRQSGRTHVGSVMYQVITRPTAAVVLLRLRWRAADRYFTKPAGHVISTFHDMPTSSEPHPLFWHDQEPAIVLARVPPDRIKLEALYDMERLFSRSARKRTGAKVRKFE